jgi:hypothetical protein
LDECALRSVPADTDLPVSGNPATEAARQAILRSIKDSCGVPLSEALEIQARHSAEFTASAFCREGSIGVEQSRTMSV